MGSRGVAAGGLARSAYRNALRQNRQNRLKSANCSTSRPRARVARADRPGRTADASGAPTTEKIVLLAIADFDSDRSPEPWPRSPFELEHRFLERRALGEGRRRA